MSKLVSRLYIFQSIPFKYKEIFSPSIRALLCKQMQSEPRQHPSQGSLRPDH